ncbi:MAG: hypothetical protein LBE55_01355, partial [Clostridiales bacterium]|nr:hypothetical protein [Clostridiales bacterium]
MMSKPASTDKLRDFLFENKVVLLFLVITALAFWASGMTTVVFFSELFTRFGRNTFMVLSLIIPVVAGLGLNFGIVIGAMAAQIAMFLVVLWGGSGVGGVFSVALLATPIAIVLGFLIGKLFNKMKGSEMIGGLVARHFAEGFYQFFFLFVLGGLIVINNERLMTPGGVGVINAIDLNASPNYMRQALDNISMFNILNIGFFFMVAVTVLLICYRLIKKQRLNMFGPKGLFKVIAPTGVLLVGYILTWTVQPFLFFTYQSRLNGVYASRLSALFLAGFLAYRIFMEIRAAKGDDSPKKPPIKRLVQLAFVVIGFAITL